MRFLVVDDNLMLAKSIRNYVVENGHCCTAMEDGTKALEWLDHNK